MCRPAWIHWRWKQRILTRADSTGPCQGIIYIIIIIIKEIVFDVMLTIALQAFCVLDGSFPAIGGHTEAALGRFYLSYILYYILCILYILHIFYILYIFGKEEPKAGNRPSRVGTARSCVLTCIRFLLVYVYCFLSYSYFPSIDNVSYRFSCHSRFPRRQTFPVIGVNGSERLW